MTILIEGFVHWFATLTLNHIQLPFMFLININFVVTLTLVFVRMER